MSDPLGPSQSCKYCNNLRPGRTTDIPYDEWVPGICSSKCWSCQIVVQATEKLYPGFLKGDFDREVAVSRPGTTVSLSVNERCRVVIGVSKDGWGHKVVDFQLYYPLIDAERASSRILQIGTAGDICSIPGDPNMWSFLRTCLSQCTTRHKLCKAAQDSSYFPERLLHVTKSKSREDSVQLIETKHQLPTSRYIALSHCWGSNSPLCLTTKKTLSSHLESLMVSQLPRTFQDCVTAARELDVQYIWIDSLCIIQDDRKDWARHARSMDKIYENALFTLAAVSSPNSQVPFLGAEAPSDRENWQAVDIDVNSGNMDPDGTRAEQLNSQLKARRYDAYLFPTFFDGPLEGRGWAWQERYLAVRVINFTKEQARWQCKESMTCECIGVMEDVEAEVAADATVPKKEEQKLTRAQEWRHVVTEYSKRQLTYTTDRLPALSGVASRFQPSMRSEYLAGLWLSDFPRCLAWYRRELSDSPKGKPKMWRSLDNDVPSWSWASIFREAYWMWDFDFELSSFEERTLESKVELLRTRCKPSSDNIFGEVEEGSYIELKGMVVEAEMESDIYGNGCVRRKDFGPQHVVPDCHIVCVTKSSLFGKANELIRRALPTDRLPESLSEGERSKGKVGCLLLFTTTRNGKNHACVLIVGKLDGRNNTYQRLGIGNSDAGCSRPLYKNRTTWDVYEGWEEFEEWERWEEWFADAEVRRVKLV